MNNEQNQKNLTEVFPLFSQQADAAQLRAIIKDRVQARSAQKYERLHNKITALTDTNTATQSEKTEATPSEKHEEASKRSPFSSAIRTSPWLTPEELKQANEQLRFDFTKHLTFLAPPAAPPQLPETFDESAITKVRNAQLLQRTQRTLDRLSARNAEQREQKQNESSHTNPQKKEPEKKEPTQQRKRTRIKEIQQTETKQPETKPAETKQVRAQELPVGRIRTLSRLESKGIRRRGFKDITRRKASTLIETTQKPRSRKVQRRMIVQTTENSVQIGVLEDSQLVEHYIAQSAEQSLIGNVYIGRVQNVLPGMEAAFVDIGLERNAVLYAGELNWTEHKGSHEEKRIENMLSPGKMVLVQVTKDPVGHKGARLTTQISLPGRHLVYLPEGTTLGISRRLSEPERQRLKGILQSLFTDKVGLIVRTAAEGATEDQLKRDVSLLQEQWETIQKQVKKHGESSPRLVHAESDTLMKLVRDIFNEDFEEILIQGKTTHRAVHKYIERVAPDLLDRVKLYSEERNIFDRYHIVEQVHKALDRKVWLPSGGSLVIDRTEAMTVIDVNTGKFVGSGGTLEETVTKNNLEAAEEIVRQLRLRDIGGIIVIDFIDMLLESNRDLVLRRLVDCLSRDRTKHQVAEVSSLGLVQMTRKKLGLGLLESFSSLCPHCDGRGAVVRYEGKMVRSSGSKRGSKKTSSESASEEVAPIQTPHTLTDETKDAVALIAAKTIAGGKSGAARRAEAESEDGGGITAEERGAAAAEEARAQEASAVKEEPEPNEKNGGKAGRRRASSAGSIGSATKVSDKSSSATDSHVNAQETEQSAADTHPSAAHAPRRAQRAGRSQNAATQDTAPSQESEPSAEVNTGDSEHSATAAAVPGSAETVSTETAGADSAPADTPEALSQKESIAEETDATGEANKPALPPTSDTTPSAKSYTSTFNPVITEEGTEGIVSEFPALFTAEKTIIDLILGQNENQLTDEELLEKSKTELQKYAEAKWELPTIFLEEEPEEKLSPKEAAALLETALSDLASKKTGNKDAKELRKLSDRIRAEHKEFQGLLEGNIPFTTLLLENGHVDMQVFLKPKYQGAELTTFVTGIIEEALKQRKEAAHTKRMRLVKEILQPEGPRRAGLRPAGVPTPVAPTPSPQQEISEEVLSYAETVYEALETELSKQLDDIILQHRLERAKMRGPRVEIGYRARRPRPNPHELIAAIPRELMIDFDEETEPVETEEIEAFFDTLFESSEQGEEFVEVDALDERSTPSYLDIPTGLQVPKRGGKKR